MASVPATPKKSFKESNPKHNKRYAPYGKSAHAKGDRTALLKPQPIGSETTALDSYEFPANLDAITADDFDVAQQMLDAAPEGDQEVYGWSPFDEKQSYIKGEENQYWGLLLSKSVKDLDSVSLLQAIQQLNKQFILWKCKTTRDYPGAAFMQKAHLSENYYWIWIHVSIEGRLLSNKDVMNNMIFLKSYKNKAPLNVVSYLRPHPNGESKDKFHKAMQKPMSRDEYLHTF